MNSEVVSKRENIITPYWNNECGRYGTGESYDYFPTYDDEVETFDSEDGLWTCTDLDEGIEILRYNGNEVNIVVPAEIMGKNVISLASTFDGFIALKSVVVPENVTSIDGAFYGCESMEQVSLPQNIVSLCYAFNCCFTLEHIDLPPALKDASWAFECTRIKNIELPNSIENISRAFMSCEHLECVHIPATVIDLTEAFSDCENLTEVVLEDGITSIGDYAFFNCTSLKELTIPESVTDFGDKSVGMMEIREYVSPDESGYQIKGYQIKGYQKIPSFIIKGKAGSEAERYAKKHRIDFVKI